MESDNLAKFKKIVAGLSPEKRKQIYDRMKGMSKEEAMAVIDRMVEISEQRKIEITARPKVLAGTDVFLKMTPSTDYEVKVTAHMDRKALSDDSKIEIVKNPGKKSTQQDKLQLPDPQQHPIKKVEPSVARAGRDQVARQIEQKRVAALKLNSARKEKNKETVKKAGKVCSCLF